MSRQIIIDIVLCLFFISFQSQYLGMYVYQVKAQDPDQGPSGLMTYSFLVDKTITQKTADFMINPVTGVIRAETVFDREQKDLYNVRR